jgi:homoserine dehydrogenase
VANYGYELLQIAKEKGVNYLFEASVGGGIPILRPSPSAWPPTRSTRSTEF